MFSAFDENHPYNRWTDDERLAFIRSQLVPNRGGVTVTELLVVELERLVKRVRELELELDDGNP